MAAEATYTVAVDLRDPKVARVEVWRTKTGGKVAELDVRSVGDCVKLGLLLTSREAHEVPGA